MESAVLDTAGETKKDEGAWPESRRKAQARRAKELNEKIRLEKEAAENLEAGPLLEPGPPELSMGVGAGSIPAVADSVPVQLDQMRWVSSRPAMQDRTHGDKECRKWMNKDRRGFMAAKTKLEEALLKSRGNSPVAGERGMEADVGEKAALELVERLLAGFKVGNVE